MTSILPTIATAVSSSAPSRSEIASRPEIQGAQLTHASHSAPSPTGRVSPKERRQIAMTRNDRGSYEAASLLISETAHDLRAPLSTAREAVRLVRDGELGHLSTRQSECLTAAINQCNCVFELVDDLAQTRQFESGFPNVRREWLSIDEVRQHVDSTLQPWIIPRDIRMLWDGPFGQGETIYADPTLLRRLLINLAGNAIDATRDGASILIRVTPSHTGGKLNWSIVDQGSGIVSSDLERIRRGEMPANRSGGLGLMISRQLAAANFSTLRIESRVGTGTVASFHTGFGGPADIAAMWANWRQSMLSNPDSSHPDRTAHQIQSTDQPNVSVPNDPSTLSVPRRFRIDSPSQKIELRTNQLKPYFPDHVYLTTVSVGAASSVPFTHAFDSLLQRSLRATEFGYRTGRRSWVIAWDADGQTAAGKRIDLERIARDEFDGSRITWGTGTVVEASATSSDQTLLARLSDLMVRQSLFAAQHACNDSDQGRLGSTPIRHTGIAPARLDKEVSRIRKR